MVQHAVLLMSDIVESTRLIDAMGDAAYAALFARHDAIVEQLARKHRGRELNRSDGVLMRFHAVDGAAAFAIDYHAALATLGTALQARVGIHVGPIDFRDAVDARGAGPGLMPGMAVPMTSRVMALAAGGQTLMSGAARAALSSSVCRAVGHGHWRMKGLAEPVEIFEIGDATRDFTPPVDTVKGYRVVYRHGLWLPRRDTPHTLPAERDRFVGRGPELGALAALVAEDARLITVVGPGGGGKTRLVQRFGWRWLGDFEGGVWYCDLTQATSGDGLVSAVAQGLALQLGASAPIEQIATAIAARGDCAIVLDNFEQLVRFAPETLGHWLDAAARARFVVTSRTVLGLPGEHVLRLESMQLPEGVELFADRARAVNRTSAPTVADERGASAELSWLERDRQNVEALVRLLDGIPLAIELAAARLRVMDLATLRARMSEGFKILTAGGGRVSRHATLRATIDWSWGLLSDVERCALAQASVFEGGFDLVAFEHVVDPSALQGEAPVDVLQSLVEQSLVRNLRPLRFDLLGSVQVYAAEHLATPGSFVGSGPHARAAAFERHSRYFASIDEERALADRCVDIDNLMAAVRRAVALDRPDDASRALVNAWAALRRCGPYRTGHVLASEVNALPGLPDVAAARVAFVAGNVSRDLGDYVVAEAHFERGLQAARAAGSRYEEARLLRARGELAFAAGRDREAGETLADALAAAQEIDDALLQCVALNGLGTLAQSGGDNATALARYATALELAERIGDRRWAGALLGNMGIAHYGLGDRDAARAHYVRSLEIAERFGDLRWIGNTRSNLGLVLADQGQVDAALDELAAALKIARHLGHRRLECVALWNRGIALAAQGDAHAARTEYDAARDLAVRLGDRRSIALLDRHIEALTSSTTAA